ncbi:MAG TPA: hypothetical protein VFV01_34140, partial [Spirillospora sp.]|nr:hypothetical protein [Spirillospora sp.]
MEESRTQAPPAGAVRRAWWRPRRGRQPTAGAYPRLVLTPVPPDGVAARPGAVRVPGAASGGPASGNAAGTVRAPGAPGMPGAAWAVAAGVAVLLITEELGRRANAPHGVTAMCSAAAFAVAAAPGLAA